ncbi:MAG: HAD hydrolase-like protein [Treponema sp.]|jgi:phosphoglycolate phosphatase|nr:HAD hydrolase-like protein [Treponema sp.]
MRFKCVVFDLDGTLVNTLADIALAMNTALDERGFPALPVAAYSGIVGNGIRHLVRSVLPEEKRNEEVVEELARRAGQLYAEKPVVHSKIYPGIQELLFELGKLKIRSAVLTNKSDLVARMVIDRLFPAGAFEAVQGELPGVPRKPDPASTWELLLRLDVTPRETIFAGDSEVDLDTARAAECSPLLVSWGFRGREALEKAGAPRIIDRPEELLALVRETRI